MFAQVVQDSSEKSGEAQAPGLVLGLSSSLSRGARWLRRLARRVAARAQDKAYERQLGTLRWCDSAERRLLGEYTDR